MERLGALSGSGCMWLCANGSHFQDVAAFFFFTEKKAE